MSGHRVPLPVTDCSWPGLVQQWERYAAVSQADRSVLADRQQMQREAAERMQPLRLLASWLAGDDR